MIAVHGERGDGWDGLRIDDDELHSQRVQAVEQLRGEARRGQFTSQVDLRLWEEAGVTVDQWGLVKGAEVHRVRGRLKIKDIVAVRKREAQHASTARGLGVNEIDPADVRSVIGSSPKRGLPRKCLTCHTHRRHQQHSAQRGADPDRLSTTPQGQDMQGLHRQQHRDDLHEDREAIRAANLRESGDDEAEFVPNGTLFQLNIRERNLKIHPSHLLQMEMKQQKGLFLIVLKLAFYSLIIEIMEVIQHLVFGVRIYIQQLYF